MAVQIKIPRIGIRGTSGVLNGRTNSGFLTLIIQTPRLTNTNANKVPKEVKSPATLPGINAAKAFAFANKIPILGVNHIKGHIYANEIESEMQFPLISLVVSGGHTELILMKGHNRFEQIGATQDDAVGEAYDKVARVLGLGYPGGPIVDKLSKDGEDTYKLPRPYLNKKEYNFSFSGVKSAVINVIHNANQRNEEIRVKIESELKAGLSFDGNKVNTEEEIDDLFAIPKSSHLNEASPLNLFIPNIGS